MANINIKLRKKKGSTWDVLHPESSASYILTSDGRNVQRFIDTVYDKTATPTENGAMSKEDKAKLNGIEEGANKYIHPNTPQIRHVTDTQIKSFNDKYTKAEIDNMFSGLNSGLYWKDAVDSFSNLATTYPNPEDGWTANVKDTDITYRYTGTEWVAISANAIPIATKSVDGKMSKEDKVILDGLTPQITTIKNDLASDKKKITSNTEAIETINKTSIKKFSTYVGNGIQSEFVFTHGLGNSDLIVTLKEVATNTVVYTNIKYDATSITVTFEGVPTQNQYKLIVLG